MNILLQFEDKHGCSSLFKNYFPECEKYLDFNNGLSNSGVFSIEGSLLANYDLTIFVYDLDSYGDGSLMLKEESFDAATNWMLPYIDKIVFIPVFFCFETLVLFSYQFKEILSNNNALTKVLLHYAKYYDYSKVIPEVLDNYKNNLNGVSKYNQDKNIFYPQMFHQEYLKNLLQVMYPNISAKKLEDKFKNTSKLLTYLNKHNQLIGLDHLTYDSILDGLLDYAKYNQEFLNLLQCSKIEDMIRYAGKTNYDRVVNLMNTYRNKLEGTMKASNESSKSTGIKSVAPSFNQNQLNPMHLPKN